jgi:oligopeptide transport system substrate-binding protein
MSAAWAARLRRVLALALALPVALVLLALARRARIERADFVFNNGNEVTSLDPTTVSGQSEGRVVSALFEGLTVKDPETLAPLPGAAESWDVSPEGLLYTFHLRPARWSNGDELTAEDFVWSWRRLLEPETAAPYARLLWCVRGAREFGAPELDAAARASLWPEVGIRSSDARTLEVDLEHPTPYFLALTSFHPLYPVHRASLEHFQKRFPERWQSEWMKPGHLVSNGPYKLRDRRVNDRLRLVKNPEYWDAHAVAFQTIDVLAIEHAGTALNLYLAGEIDWLDRVPPQLVPRLSSRPDFEPAPYLASYFYRVNTTKAPFNDPRVRRALALAIDRRALCEKVLQKGELPSWSLTPPGLAGYPRPEMAHAAEAGSDHESAFAQDCADARALLAEAGFGSGRALPPLEIHFNTSETHRDIAEVIAAGWSSALGIETRLLNQEWKSYLDSQQNLRYDVSRSSWIGDYADPNTFLETFVSGGENNRTGWGNARYDGLVSRAAREGVPARRLALLAEAERVLLEELPILPIYSYVSQNLVSPRLGGFFANVQDEHPVKFWHWKSAEERGR